MCNSDRSGPEHPRLQGGLDPLLGEEARGILRYGGKNSLPRPVESACICPIIWIKHFLMVQIRILLK